MGDALMPEIWNRNYRRGDLMRRVGRLEQVAGIRLVTLGDGAERGVRLLEFRTGTMAAMPVELVRGRIARVLEPALTRQERTLLENALEP